MTRASVKLELCSLSLSSFGRASTPGQTQTGLGPRVYPFYYPRLLYCLDQMLAVTVLSQHRVLSSKTVSPLAPCSVRGMGHVIRTWSAVRLEATHSDFYEIARLHLCIDEWNFPTPVFPGDRA